MLEKSDFVKLFLLFASFLIRAKIIFRDRNMFSFDLRATDEHEIICRGTHKLRVIRKARLASVVSAKDSKP